MLRSLALAAACVGAAVYAPASSSATPLAAATKEPLNEAIYLWCGMDWVGNDIKNLTETNPDACPWLCASTEGCQQATWTKYQGGTCFLKARGPRNGATMQPDAGAISYSLEPKASWTDVKAIGSNCWAHTDMRAFDIGSTTAPGTITCSELCKLSPKCWAFVYDENTRICTLKSRGSGLVAYKGRHTCIMQRRIEEQYGLCPPL